MLMRLIRKREKGIGLLELMLSLAIIAVLIIMATRYYQATRRSSEMNQVVSSVNGIIAAAETWRVGRGDYTGISIDILVTNKYLPEGSATSVWGGKYSISPSGGSATISLSSIPSGMCDQLKDRLKALEPTCNGQLTVKIGAAAGAG